MFESNEKIVLPGDHLGCCDDYEAGVGIYEDNKNLKACLAGKIVVEQVINSNRLRINVISPALRCAAENVVDVGDMVLARVTRINLNQIVVDILCVGDTLLSIRPKGIIRREDIRISEVDKIVMHECFRPGDVVRAHILSLGDARQYFLSTADAEDGVIWARSQTTGNILIPISWKVIL